MEDFELIAKFHLPNKRQGPGGDSETQLAAQLAGIDDSKAWTIADIGCGTGVASLHLAKLVPCKIHAVDFLPSFVAEANRRAESAGVADKIEAVVGDMGALAFEPESLDVIWSEGAVYNIGFEKGISEWKKFLKVGGRLVVSELTWLTEDRPQEIEDYWNKNYPEVGTSGSKIRQLEKHGYKMLGYFPLPQKCWDEYYQELEARQGLFARENPDRASDVDALIKENEQESALYYKYKDYVSYGVYVAERVA